MSDTTYATVELTQMTCGSCGIVFAMPEQLRREAKRHKGQTWYCPNGHARIYTTTVEDELRETREVLARERARLDQVRADRDRIDRSRSAIRGQLTKAKRRVGNGVCPCCNRTFENLRRHMDFKHPEYAKPEPAPD
jgi:hypothetical protein